MKVRIETQGHFSLVHQFIRKSRKSEKSWKSWKSRKSRKAKKSCGCFRRAKVRIETQGHFRPSDRWPRVSTFRISVSKVLLGLLTKVDQISHFILYPCGSVGHSLTLRLASLFPQFSKALFIQIATQGHLKDFSLNFRFPSSVDLVTTNSSRRRLYVRQFSNKWQFLHFSRSWTTPKKM